MTIDAHQHFWRIGEHDCTWPTPNLPAIHRNFEPADLESVAAPLGVVGSVLVQSQPSDQDTDWLIDLAARTALVKAVVGWADLKSPGAPERITALAAAPKMRGLRPMLQSLPDDAWILDPAVDPAIEAMIAHGLTFDALVYTRHLPYLRTFAQRFPSLPIVIDHAAKPPIASGDLEAWRREIASLAALPNVFCKLSGLVTEGTPGQRIEAFAHVVDHLLEVFGPSRLMWGSDWPVLNLAAAYGGWFGMAGALCRLSEDEGALLFGAVARAFYRL